MRWAIGICGLTLAMLCGCQSTSKPVVLNTSNCGLRCQNNSPLQIDPQPEIASEIGHIEDFVQLGLTRNPRIQEARYKIEALRHKIPQTLSLPDPEVNTTTHLAPVQTAAGEQAFALGIRQTIVNADRRAARASLVSQEVKAAQANLRLIEMEIAEQIRKACWQLLLARQSLKITRDDRKSLQKIEEYISESYRVGNRSVGQQEAINVRIEQSKIENQLIELAQQEKTYQARLARLLRLNPESEFEILDPLMVKDNAFAIDKLTTKALKSRPDLQAQIANIQTNERKIHLAHLENKPDFTIGLNWIATSSSGVSPVANGDDAVLLNVGFNLPIYKQRIHAAVSEARANRLAAESRLSSLQDQVTEEVFDTIQQLATVHQTLTLIQEDILPNSQRAYELSIDEYRAGSIEYLPMIENWRKVLKYKFAEANLQAQYQQLKASLTRAVGQTQPIETITEHRVQSDEPNGRERDPR